MRNGREVSIAGLACPRLTRPPHGEVLREAEPRTTRGGDRII
jgi:hypothetical protein